MWPCSMNRAPVTAVSTQKLPPPAWLRGTGAASVLPSICGVAASLSYRPRRPEQGVLHQIVREHYETFRAEAAEHRDGQGLPILPQLWRTPHG